MGLTLTFKTYFVIFMIVWVDDGGRAGGRTPVWCRMK